MGALEKLRERNRFDETLPSGLAVTLRLPRIRDCIIAGQVPLPVLEHLQSMAQAGGETPTVSHEDAAHMARFQDEIVRRAVVALEGEPVSLSLDDVGELTQEDYDRIVVLATRAENPTPADSPA
jgi:hypothetical protein